MLLGGSKCKVLSVLDLKDTFHLLRLNESSKKYCEILPYFGSASYLYQRMPMGLNISPAVWKSYINTILSCLSSRNYCEAIMDTMPHISQEPTTTPKPITADYLNALLQMQRTDPFCKCISKRLLNGKAPCHEFDTFTHVKGLLYKHITDAGKKFLTLVIPKSWKYTVLVEAHDKLGHQGNSCTYCLIKCQYYWKGMNKDI